MRYLIDTNVISEMRKPRPDAHVEAWVAGVNSSALVLSVIVVGEIRQGIERLRPRDPAQADVFETWLAQVEGSFRDRILPVTSDIAQEWGRMRAKHLVPVTDGLLAATAKVHGLTLVTRNVRDVAACGVTIVNPFAP